MPLFQKSVVKKYINDLNTEQLQTAWLKFQNHFHNTAIQQNIINAKEVEYQEGFVRDLFVNILGYTLKPQPEFNLVMEQKSTTDATKSDGAILSIQGSVVAVIELKDTSTANLDKVEKQAFGYKHQHKDCLYVVTANFEQLRFYINDATEYEAFNLFTLNRESFALLYCCLQQTALHNDVPLKMKQQSLAAEENITKKLYEDYSRFKKQLFANITAQNPQFTPLELFKKTQKLLDRFLFIFFAEDRLLLPPNSIREILNQWNLLNEIDQYIPLYDRFKKYFGYMNTGYVGKQYEIFAYNGGLFAADEILDNIVIEDQFLYHSCKGLSNYDFESEVDVNILGHIFEHSLGELEAAERELSDLTNAEVALQKKQTSKRKKDGVFYTPRYITKYIVVNTVGALCSQKKVELSIVEDDFAPQKRKVNTKQLLQKLETYRQWLLQITICDPACGSGAFLNQALEFLIAEHQSIDALTSKLFGAPMILSDIETGILENNLYGVDINNEATEIAKLSLWLRTARKGRKLNSLSNHIKCGNSLIDNVGVAGDKAFNWQKEFPDVFARGGFDVVIGNPPYLRVQGLRESFAKESIYYEKGYKTATGRFDIYILFIEKAFSLINNFGTVSFILPHKFMVSDFGEGVRKFLIEEKAIKSIVSFGAEMVFSDASTYTCILNLSKENKEILYSEIKIADLSLNNYFKRISYSNLSKEKWNMQNEEGISLFKKLDSQPYKAKDIFENISQGIVSVGDEIFIMKGKFIEEKFIGYSEKIGKSVEIESSLMKPLLKGEDIKKYSPLFVNHYVIYPHYEKNGKTVPYEEEEFKKKFPLGYSYFLLFKDELIEKKLRYKTNPRCWYSLHRSREMSLFKSQKIITPEISLGTNMTLDSEHIFHNTKCYSLVKKSNLNLDNRFLLSILNSKLLWFFLNATGYVLRGGYFTFKTKYLEPFPIPDYTLINQLPFVDQVEIMLSKNKELQSLNDSLLRLLQSKFEGLTLSKKLQDWSTLSFKEFLKELEKQKIKFSLPHQAEWMQYFETEKTKANTIQQLITETDKKINEMVYTLYDLSEAEKSLIEAG